MPFSPSLLTGNANDIWENTSECCDVPQPAAAFLIDMKKKYQMVLGRSEW